MYHIGTPGLLPDMPTPAAMSNVGVEFIKKCLVKDPNVRDSAAELLEEEFCVVSKEELEVLEEWVMMSIAA